MSIIQLSKIIQRSGNISDLVPGTLSESEIGFASDANRVFIGSNGGGNLVELLTSYSSIDFSQITGAGGIGIDVQTPALEGQVLAFDSANNSWTNRGNSSGGVISLGDVSNVKISDGAIGYVLETDGTGNLTWSSKGTITAAIQDLNYDPGNLTTVMTVNPSIPYVNYNEITVSGVDGANANTVINGKTFYLTVAVDYPTSGNVYLWEDALATIPVTNAIDLGYIANGQAVSRVGSLANFAGGTNTTVQINDSGILNGSSRLKFDKNTGNLDVTGNVNVIGGSFVGPITLTGIATFDNTGLGVASPTTFNGTVSRTISYNTIGAPSVTGVNATGNAWNIGLTSGSNSIIPGNATIIGAWTLPPGSSLTGNVSGNFTGNFSGNVTLSNAVTFNNSGTGAASPSTYNGTAARTVSYNTVGAPSTTGVNATGNAWNIGLASGGNAVTPGNATIVGAWTLPAGSSLTGNISGNFSGNITGNVTLSNSVTFNNSGAGDASGSAFNGSAARTISYNSVGAPSITGVNATGNAWNIGISDGTRSLIPGNGAIIGSWLLAAGSTLQATYADLAESYVADQRYEPGTVLEFGGEHEVTVATDETRRLAGVVTTKPAYVMNSTCAGEHVAVIALIGRTPVKVRGRIRKGDMLCSGGNGYARPSNYPMIGTIIGKALEDFDGTDGVIEVAVGRH